MQLSPRTMRPRASQRCATTASSGAWARARGSPCARESDTRAPGPHRRPNCVRHDRPHPRHSQRRPSGADGAQTGGRHKRSARLRHGQRHVLARIEPGLDGLQCLGSVELRGYTVNEHAVPPASQRQKARRGKLGGYAADFVVCHGSAWRGLQLRRTPSPATKTPDRTELTDFAKISPSRRTPQPRKVPQETAIPQKSSQRSGGSSTHLWCWQNRRVVYTPAKRPRYKYRPSILEAGAKPRSSTSPLGASPRCGPSTSVPRKQGV